MITYEYDYLGRQRHVIQPDPDEPGSGDDAPEWFYEYDAAGNLVEIIDPLERVTTYDYDKLGRRIKVTLPDPDGVDPLLAPVTVYVYDAASQLTSQITVIGELDDDVNLETNDLVTAYEYDALGRQTKITQPDPDEPGTGLASPFALYAYNADGLLESVTDPEGRTTTYEYDALGRRVKVTLPDPDGGGNPLLAPITVYVYDDAGQLYQQMTVIGEPDMESIETDDLVTTYDYDALGRVTSVTNPNDEATLFTYDRAGNRLTLTDAETNETTWTYDNLNRVIQEENQLEQSWYFLYDAQGNLFRKSGRGPTTEYLYDRLGRMIEEYIPGEEDPVYVITYDYDLASQLVEVVSPEATYHYDYDALGRKITITSTLDGLAEPVVLHQRYDEAGRRVALDAVIGETGDFVNDYLHDNLGRMTRVTQSALDNVGGNSVADKRVDFTYKANSQFDTISRYAATTASHLVAASAYGYDLAGRLVSLAHIDGESTPLAGYVWSFDQANRIDAFTNSLYAAESAVYSYDNAGQLTGADRTVHDETYAYDDNGNRDGIDYEINPNNQLATDGVYYYYYNDAGSLRLRQEDGGPYYTEYGWDHRQRLTSVTEYEYVEIDYEEVGVELWHVTYAYDAFNRMVSRTEQIGVGDPGTTYFIYDPMSASGQMVLQLDDEGDVLQRLLWGPQVDQILANENGSGDVYWTLTDQQNTVRDVVSYDAIGEETILENHIVYDSFGKVLTQSDDSLDMLSIKYTGHYFDIQTGLQWNLNRWYNPETGLWISEDPIGFEGGQFNLNVYVGDSPTNGTDPSGLWKYVPDMGRLLVTLGPQRQGFEAFFSLSFLPDRDKFKSDPRYACVAEVRFVQIVKVSVNSGTLGKGFPFSIFHTLDEWHIDSGPPYYEDSSGDPRTDFSITMNDSPGFGFLHFSIQTVSYDFETAVVSSKGPSKGDVFGAVQWGFSYTVTGPAWNRRVVAQKYYVNDLVWSDAQATNVVTTDLEGEHTIELGGPSINSQTYKSFVPPRAPSDTMTKLLKPYFP